MENYETLDIDKLKNFKNLFDAHKIDGEIVMGVNYGLT